VFVLAENTSPYSRLLWWSVENFMAIEKGKCEFDEKNIINLKGYNDSGKSAMLTALKVLLNNSHPTKQVEFIQDGKDYFRILAYFDDGVMILRDKYVNGQSLYEMYKDGQVIFSTKQKNGALASVKGVPEPIQQYLGLITYEDTLLNARACFEKQIGVQTTGSENYKMFNTVLKSEEIAVASSMLNNDKNKLVSDINGVESDLRANKEFISGKDRLTLEMIQYLKEHDKSLDANEMQLVHLNEATKLVSDINGVVIYPEVKAIDNMNELVTILSLRNTLKDIVITPEVKCIDTLELTDLLRIKTLSDDLSSITVANIPELSSINNEQLNAILGIKTLFENLSLVTNEIASNEQVLVNNTLALEELQTKLQELGVSYVRCPSCGNLFDASKTGVCSC
jgi:energy-coupling factor transporter ATP-binding protein EcfA2